MRKIRARSSSPTTVLIRTPYRRSKNAFCIPITSQCPNRIEHLFERHENAEVRQNQGRESEVAGTVLAMKRTLAALAALPLLVSLAACGGDEKPKADKTVTVSPTPTPAPSDEPSEADVPTDNLGERALPLGKERRGAMYTTTLLEVKDMEPDSSRVPKEGMRFVGIRVKSCSNPDADPAHNYNGEWALVLADGTEYAGNGESWPDWPVPKYNENADLPPGSCKQGWMALEVPPNLKVDRVRWSPMGTPTAEWLVGKNI